ncbi:MAG TPA: glycosyltransferase family protein [Cytophagaceae bacterium]|jgi:uncharacterized protein (TIGR00661 family)
MKVLYAIQGTGNGHISRARDIIPLLQNKCNLDVMISGTQADITLPHPIKYKYKGLSFIFGKNGGVDLLNTYLKNNTKSFLKEINNFPIEDYDLVINDFEPITAWAAYLKNKECIALSHQSAVMCDKAPRPSNIDMMGLFILKNYAPFTAKYGFHFSEYGDNIFTPVIREEIRSLKTRDDQFYLVYLPSYEDARIIDILTQIRNVKWKVFSKHNIYVQNINNVSIAPIHNEKFVEALGACTGLLCGAGFEAPAEALYLQKKLMVIPMKSQYEQHCNAAALKQMGVPVIKSLKAKNIHQIQDWVNGKTLITVNYPDQTEGIIDMILEKHGKLRTHYAAKRYA